MVDDEIGAPASHACRDCDCFEFTSAGDYLGLGFGVLGIEKTMRYGPFNQGCAESSRLSHASGRDQHRAPEAMPVCDLRYHALNVFVSVEEDFRAHVRPTGLGFGGNPDGLDTVLTCEGVRRLHCGTCQSGDGLVVRH